MADCGLWAKDKSPWLIVDSNETPGGLASTSLASGGSVRGALDLESLSHLSDFGPHLGTGP